MPRIKRKLVYMSILAISGDVVVETSPYTLGDGYHSTVTYERGIGVGSVFGADIDVDSFLEGSFEEDLVSSDSPIFGTHQSEDGLVVIDLFQEGLPLVGAFSGLLGDDLTRLEGEVLNGITSSEGIITAESMSSYFELEGSERVMVSFRGQDVSVFRLVYKLLRPLPRELFYGELGYALAEAMVV